MKKEVRPFLLNETKQKKKQFNTKVDVIIIIWSRSGY